MDGPSSRNQPGAPGAQTFQTHVPHTELNTNTKKIIITATLSDDGDEGTRGVGSRVWPPVWLSVRWNCLSLQRLHISTLVLGNVILGCLVLGIYR